jgi:hypothetical protein
LGGCGFHGLEKQLDWGEWKPVKLADLDDSIKPKVTTGWTETRIKKSVEYKSGDTAPGLKF